MRKTTNMIILLALTLIVSETRAQQERCVHFTNFCDTITLQEANKIAYGGWDFQCGFDWSTVNIIGSSGKTPELATRPLDDEYPFPYTMQFSFRPGVKLFDLDGTAGVDGGISNFQTNVPYNITNGACSGTDVDRSKPKLLSSTHGVRNTLPHHQGTTHCMHFKNFCDTIVFSTSGTLAYGNWDWQCQADWTTSSVMGNDRTGAELTTRPRYASGGFPYLYPYSTQFSFKAGQLFDLYETAGVGQGVFITRSNEPFTISNGSCGPSDVETSKPRLVDR